MKAFTLSFSLLFLCSNTFAQDTAHYVKYERKYFDIGRKVNGKYNGEVITFAEYPYLGDSIQIRYKTDYVDGKKEGIRIIYRYSGPPDSADGYSIISYRNDIIEGPCVRFDQSGKIERIGQFLNDNESGIWYEYYENKLSRVTDYNNKAGKAQETYFFTNGYVSATGFTSAEKEVRTGLWIEFDSSITNFSIGEYAYDTWEETKSDTTYTYEGSKEIGIWKTYNFKGELIKEENYGVKGRRNKSILLK